MKVVVLAGGLGTRLRGVLRGTPKPMAEVGGRPFLEYLVARFKAQGMDEFVFCVGHGGDTIRDHFSGGERFGISIRYTVERSLLGTGGAIKLAEPWVGPEGAFVVNGDTYLEAEIGAISRFHRTAGALATIALVNATDTARYGRVVVDGSHRITTFVEKGQPGVPGHINGGLYLFDRAVFAGIPAGRVCSLERDILPGLIGKGLYGFPVGGYFVDIGVPEDYDKARNELPSRSAS